MSKTATEDCAHGQPKCTQTYLFFMRSGLELVLFAVGVHAKPVLGG
jgi:hypothetical protein